MCWSGFRPLFTLAAFLLFAVPSFAAGPEIRLDEFSIQPTSLSLGEAFTVRAKASARGIRLGSFLLRTADEVRREATIPGLPLYSNGKYYVEESGTYFLRDNGPLDQDPASGAFTMKVDTAGWREGDYTFAFFASSRPAEGPFVIARNDFAVSVRGNRVIIEDLGPANAHRSRKILAFSVQPTRITQGGPVTICLETSDVQGIQLTDSCYIAARETLPGFQYDSDKKKSFYGRPSSEPIEDNGEYDRNSAPGKISLEIDTNGWPPGTRHFLLNAIGLAGSAVDYRSLAIQVVGPGDQFLVTVEPSRPFASGTHFNRFLKLPDGTLLSEGKLSHDGGRSWQDGAGRFGVGGEVLTDGRVLGLDYRCLPVKDREGWYAAARWFSEDRGKTFQPGEALFHVPQAKAAMGHGPHVGPLFMRSIVERRDGSLVALMAGWFKSDTALCPYGRGRPYSRTYVCESADGGKTWSYLTTIGYDQIGSEGYNEGSMKRLPGGELLAVLRTGNERDLGCQDNPIMAGISRDEGRTWSPPERTGVEGAFPSLAVLSDGVVVMSYGRPGAMLVFSRDGGRTWTDPTAVDTTAYSGYTDVVEIGPRELLVGFGAAAYLDPATGVRDDQLRLATVRYRLAPADPSGEALPVHPADKPGSPAKTTPQPHQTPAGLPGR